MKRQPSLRVASRCDRVHSKFLNAREERTDEGRRASEESREHERAARHSISLQIWSRDSECECAQHSVVRWMIRIELIKAVAACAFGLGNDMTTLHAQ